MDDIGPEEIMGLRAKERVIRRLAASGMSHPEIAWRFRCSPGHIDRTLRLTQVPRRGRDSTERRGPSALERVVRRARRDGASHAEIGARMRRSPGFIARVEQLAAIRDGLETT